MSSFEYPLVSIVIPCFNADSWLAETIENALAQTWPNREIIVVDDGSEDDSLAVARRYADRVTLIPRPHRNGSAARNVGIDAARGEFIQFLDADDLLSVDKIALQMALLARSPAGALATCRWARFRRDVNKAHPSISSLYRDFGSREFLLFQGQSGSRVPLHGWLIPRSVAARAGPWNETLTMDDDGEYSTRMLLAASVVLHCPDAACYYRTFHTRSLTKRRSRAYFDSAFRSVELSVSHLLAADVSAEMRRSCANHYQRCIYLTYPNCPDLIHKAEQRVRELGGSEVRPELASRPARLARLFGWKTVFRLRDFLWRRNIYLGRRGMISD